MLRFRLTRPPEHTELKGAVISDSSAIVERLEGALDRLEAALADQTAENARLRRIEAAASAALADLEALIGDASDMQQRN